MAIATLAIATVSLGGTISLWLSNKVTPCLNMSLQLDTLSSRECQRLSVVLLGQNFHYRQKDNSQINTCQKIITISRYTE